jgi:hypothetical protein
MRTAEVRYDGAAIERVVMHISGVGDDGVGDQCCVFAGYLFATTWTRQRWHDEDHRAVAARGVVGWAASAIERCHGTTTARITNSAATT